MVKTQLNFLGDCVDVPEGFKRRVKGKVNVGDMFWGNLTKKWQSIEKDSSKIGTSPNIYYGIIRPIGLNGGKILTKNGVLKKRKGIKIE